MKKQLLIAALGFMSVGASAQLFEEQIALPDANIYAMKRIYAKDYYFYVSNANSCQGNIFFTVFDKNMSLVKNISYKGCLAGLYYNDCEGFAIDDLYLTQTLFNDDDAFEYLEPVFPSFSQNPYENFASAIKVMSDNGKEVARITFDKPVYGAYMYFDLLRVDDKNYLRIITRYEDESGYFNKFFLINKSANGESAIREVEAPEALKAFPSLARKNQSVSIELGKHAGDRLQLTAANGSVVRQVPVKAGQKSVQLSTRGLSSGLYVVSTVGKNGAQENCKLVIK